MRDHRLTAAAHAARFALRSGRVSAVQRVLPAGRRAASLVSGQRLRLAVNVSPTWRWRGGDTVVHAVSAGRDITRTVVQLRERVTIRPRIAVESPSEAPQNAMRGQIVTSLEHRLTRTEQRLAQAVTIVTRGAAAPQAEPTPHVGGQPYDRQPATGAAASAQLQAPDTTFDLARITDHVVGALEHRLTAYSERLGRG